MEKILEYLQNNEKAFTVAGVLITLCISAISLYFTIKNNKAVHYVNSITKNRVEWIEKLRKNTSEFISILDTQNLTETLMTVDELLKYPFGSDLQKLNQIGTEIKLMLNFSDEFDRDIINQINLIMVAYKNFHIKIQSNLLSGKKNNDPVFVPTDEVLDAQKSIDKMGSELLSNMQIYLKAEWNRVKYESNGEIYEKETQNFDIKELQLKKNDPDYKNDSWKRFCKNSKAKCKRIFNSHQFAILVIIVACIILICCIPIIAKDIAAFFQSVKK